MALGAGPSTYGPMASDYYGSGGMVYAQLGAPMNPRDVSATSSVGGNAGPATLAPTAWLIGIVAFLVLWRLAYHAGASVGD